MKKLKARRAILKICLFAVVSSLLAAGLITVVASAAVVTPGGTGGSDQYIDLAPPTNLTATAADKQISLVWNYSGSGELGFLLQRSTDSSFTTVSSFYIINFLNFSDPSVSLGSTYYYRVLAYNAAGQSDPSNVAIASLDQASVSPAPVIVTTDVPAAPAAQTSVTPAVTIETSQPAPAAPVPAPVITTTTPAPAAVTNDANNPPGDVSTPPAAKPDVTAAPTEAPANGLADSQVQASVRGPARNIQIIGSSVPVWNTKLIAIIAGIAVGSVIFLIVMIRVIAGLLRRD